MHLESYQNPYKIPPKIWLDFCLVSGGFLVDFWGCFEEPGPPKMSVSPRRGAIFRKIQFFRPDAVLGWFYIDCWTILECSWDGKTYPKIKQKNNQSLNDFLMDFGIHFGSKWRPCWPHFRHQKSSQILPDFRRSPGAPVRRSRGQLPIRT